MTLVELLVEANDAECAWDKSVEAELERSLATSWCGAMEAWPGVELTLENYVGHLGLHFSATDDPVARLASMRSDELYLCAACLKRDDRALQYFEDEFGVSMARGIQSIRMPDDQRGEALQKLQFSILVGTEDTPPRLRAFGGRGPLGQWLKVAATRTALNMVRSEKRYQRHDDSAIIERMTRNVDPELAEMKRLHQPIVRRALSMAFEDLEPAERNLLRRYVIEGLTLAELAPTLGVSTTTAFRRVQKIRKGLLARTRAHLSHEVGLSPSECRSIIALAKSGLHLSIDRLLQVPRADLSERLDDDPVS